MVDVPLFPFASMAFTVKELSPKLSATLSKANLPVASAVTETLV